jgi:hypothetical protein
MNCAYQSLLLRSIFAVLLLPVAALLSITLPALADPLPTYNYFYTCSSGVENCTTFDRSNNYYGDFGMNGLVPVNWPPSVMPALTFKAKISNKEGQALGYVYNTTGGALAYGSDGIVTCLFSCLNDETYPVFGLNDNGLYVFQLNLPGVWIGLGTTEFARLGDVFLNYSFSVPVDFEPLGINDANQILVRFSDATGSGAFSGDGILSPTSIPEPSSIALVATVIGVLVCWPGRRVILASIEPYRGRRHSSTASLGAAPCRGSQPASTI